MKAMHSLAIAAVLLVGIAAASAQHAGKSNSNPAALPSVDEQVKVLAAKLDLTADQQARTRPIMQQLHDATEQIAQDQTLSPEDRLAKVRPLRMEAGKKLREFLSDEQKKKLEAYLQGPHAEMHGNLSGSAQSQKK